MGGILRITSPAERTPGSYRLQRESIPFLDHGAAALLSEARDSYHRASLDTVQIFQRGNDAVLLTWEGDWVNDGLAMLIASSGLAATNEGIVLTVPSVSIERLYEVLTEIATLKDTDPIAVLEKAKNIVREKWDWAMPDSMLKKSFASLYLDLTGAISLAAQLTYNE